MGKKKKIMRRMRTNIPPQINRLTFLPENLQVEWKYLFAFQNTDYAANGTGGTHSRDLVSNTLSGLTNHDCQWVMNRSSNFRKTAGRSVSTGTYQSERPVNDEFGGVLVRTIFEQKYRRNLVQRFSYAALFRLQYDDDTGYVKSEQDVWAGLSMRPIDPVTIRDTSDSDRRVCYVQHDQNFTRKALMGAFGTSSATGACFAGSIDLEKLAVSGGLQYNADLDYSAQYDPAASSYTQPTKEIFFCPQIFQGPFNVAVDDVNMEGYLEITQIVNYYDLINEFA